MCRECTDVTLYPENLLSLAFVILMLQDLLILSCGHPENRNSLTQMGEWPEWIPEILISNYEITLANFSLSLNVLSLHDKMAFDCGWVEHWRSRDKLLLSHAIGRLLARVRLICYKTTLFSTFNDVRNPCQYLKEGSWVAWWILYERIAGSDSSYCCRRLATIRC